MRFVVSGGLGREGKVLLLVVYVTPDGWNDDMCRKEHKFVCSQRICQNLKDDTSPVDGKNVPILFTALSSGLILVLIVASTIGFLGSRRSKTKKEDYGLR